jgi:hypothetical protein
VIGHELQHVLEQIAAGVAVDPQQSRTWQMARNQYETRSALETEKRISAELKKNYVSGSPCVTSPPSGPRPHP